MVAPLSLNIKRKKKKKKKKKKVIGKVCWSHIQNKNRYYNQVGEQSIQISRCRRDTWSSTHDAPLSKSEPPVRDKNTIQISQLLQVLLSLL
jgi:hypothetical protein